MLSAAALDSEEHLSSENILAQNAFHSHYGQQLSFVKGRGRGMPLRKDNNNFGLEVWMNELARRLMKLDLIH